VPSNAIAQARIQDFHFLDINPVTGPKYDVVDTTRAVIQRQGNTIAVSPRIQDAAFFVDWHIMQAGS
jgi:hypothetical protein